MKVMVIITNKFGDWTSAALAQRLSMHLTKSGAFAGMLSPDELDQVRQAKVDYRVNWKVTSN